VSACTLLVPVSFFPFALFSLTFLPVCYSVHCVFRNCLRNLTFLRAFPVTYVNALGSDNFDNPSAAYENNDLNNGGSDSDSAHLGPLSDTGLSCSLKFEDLSTSIIPLFTGLPPGYRRLCTRKNGVRSLLSYQIYLFGSAKCSRYREH
jgi:hypothetical protein